MRSENKIQLNAPAGNPPSLVAAVDAVFLPGRSTFVALLSKRFMLKTGF
jgi:hypothetical protein